MKEHILTDTGSIAILVAELERLRRALATLTHENTALKATITAIKEQDRMKNEALTRKKIEEMGGE